MGKLSLVRRWIATHYLLVGFRWKNINTVKYITRKSTAKAATFILPFKFHTNPTYTDFQCNIWMISCEADVYVLPSAIQSYDRYQMSLRLHAFMKPDARFETLRMKSSFSSLYIRVLSWQGRRRKVPVRNKWALYCGQSRGSERSFNLSKCRSKWKGT